MAKLRKTVERAKKHGGQSLKEGKKQTRKARATRRSSANHPTLTVASLGAPSSHYDPQDSVLSGSLENLIIPPEYKYLVDSGHAKFYSEAELDIMNQNIESTVSICINDVTV